MPFMSAIYMIHVVRWFDLMTVTSHHFNLRQQPTESIEQNMLGIWFHISINIVHFWHWLNDNDINGLPTTCKLKASICWYVLYSYNCFYVQLYHMQFCLKQNKKGHTLYISTRKQMTVKLVLLYVNLPYLVFQVTRRYRTVVDNLVNVDNPK